MPAGKHSLPDGYDRLDGQLTGPVLDSIVIHLRSHGRLHMPGEYGTDERPPGHQVKVTSARSWRWSPTVTTQLDPAGNSRQLNRRAGQYQGPYSSVSWIDLAQN
jgi:hypothetical protein